MIGQSNLLLAIQSSAPHRFTFSHKYGSSDRSDSGPYETHCTSSYAPTQPELSQPARNESLYSTMKTKRHLIKSKLFLKTRKIAPKLR